MDSACWGAAQGPREEGSQESDQTSAKESLRHHLVAVGPLQVTFPLCDWFLHPANGGTNPMTVPEQAPTPGTV